MIDIFLEKRGISIITLVERERNSRGHETVILPQISFDLCKLTVMVDLIEIVA